MGGLGCQSTNVFKSAYLDTNSDDDLIDSEE